MDLDFFNKEIEGKPLNESLAFLAEMFSGQVAFSSAFGQEDQVITDSIFRNDLNIQVFTLDTGRLFKETYDLIDQTRSRYKKHIKVYYPNTQAVEGLTSQKGMHSFYESIENRKECCYIRKVEPLKRALKGAKVWITGLRAGQSDNRQSFNMLEWDEGNQVIKFNPLLNWSYDEMIEYLKLNKVPYNKLHDQGFISIGCAPCTRAIEPGEDARAGRWWWETSKKECGLHQVKV
ncbi:phosphoadenosine phosphosulfate reductase [Roseivirga sp. 4D4]|uniref:phosphoadenylyl-sulfate reductase n=1 Tax=Roseivirga sp. 4D4 TaxID=1889784 RepID=UPI000853BD13|nr:phosphoadenylyl-sulfate reductase [Roseivirga sp. 4D4]OEK03503.1 phosphoadenosine phosphosulfate reductase [Roseivirga sp. 4D4]